MAATTCDVMIPDAFYATSSAMPLHSVDGMSRLGPTDHLPGAPIETRRLPGGAVVLIMRIAGDHQLSTATAVHLVMRCELDGQIFAAIADRSGRAV